MPIDSFPFFADGLQIARSSATRYCGRMVAFQGGGILFSAVSPRFSVPPSSSKRGSVVGLSWASALRFRRKLLQFCGPAPCYAITLTLRDYQSPDRWRRCLHAFSKRIARTPDCGFWRVELQRRGVPHLHCLAYSTNPFFWRRSWLEVWGLVGDADHEKHAVKIESMHGSGWLSYVASHASKHKEEQLGWLGRQWGVFNKSRLVPRDSFAYDLPYSLYSVALTSYKGWCLSRSDYVPRSDFVLRFDDGPAIDALKSCFDFALSDVGVWFSFNSYHCRLLFMFSCVPLYSVPVGAVLRFLE